MFLDYIEIGTSDFNTEIENKDNKKGLSIDPVKYYIDKLPNKTGCIKINNGISNFNGEITVHYISNEDIIKYKLPDYVKGCNSVNHYHPTIEKLLLNMGIKMKDIVVSDRVPCKTLLSLLSEYNCDGFYFLKIDTEGHDCIILEHFLKNNKSNHLLPHLIMFESNELVNKSHVRNILEILKKIGYDLVSPRYDLDNSHGDSVLKLNLNKIDKTFTFSTKIVNYYIEDYPKGYDPNNLPHKNTLEAAKMYCIQNKCSGVTYQNNRYEVRNGNYMNYYNDPKLLSWILL